MSTSIIFIFISHSFYRAAYPILRRVVAFYNRVARVLRFPDGLCPILSRYSAQCLLHHVIYFPKVLVRRVKCALRLLFTAIDTVRLHSATNMDDNTEDIEKMSQNLTPEDMTALEELLRRKTDRVPNGLRAQQTFPLKAIISPSPQQQYFPYEV